MTQRYIIQKFSRGQWVALTIPMRRQDADKRIQRLHKTHPTDRVRAVTV